MTVAGSPIVELGAANSRRTRRRAATQVQGDEGRRAHSVLEPRIKFNSIKMNKLPTYPFADRHLPSASAPGPSPPSCLDVLDRERSAEQCGYPNIFIFVEALRCAIFVITGEYWELLTRHLV